MHVEIPDVRLHPHASGASELKEKADMKSDVVNRNISLTHLLLDKMTAISQSIFSDAFSRMKSLVF